MKKHAVFALAGLLACAAASAQELDYGKAKKKKRPPPDPASVWPHRWYLGGSLHQVTFGDGWSTVEKVDDGSFRSTESDGSDTGYAVQGGIEFRGPVAVALELGYLDIGTVTYAAQSDGSGPVWAAGPIREELAMKGTMLSGQLAVPIGAGFAACARLGVLAWKIEDAYSGTTKSGPVDNGGSVSNRAPAYGLGAAYGGLDDWQLRATYMRYNVSDWSNEAAVGDVKTKVDQLEFSVAYLF